MSGGYNSVFARKLLAALSHNQYNYVYAIHRQTGSIHIQLHFNYVFHKQFLKKLFICQ